MRDLRVLRGKRRVVVLARGLGIERQVELILPAELEARFRERVGTLTPDGLRLVVDAVVGVLRSDGSQANAISAVDESADGAAGTE